MSTTQNTRPSKRPKPSDADKQVTSYHSHSVWATFPRTIKWLQKERPNLHTRIDFEQIRGVNATIVLLSAACIEGFLIECLQSYAIGNIFSPKDTFEGRLDHAFLNNVSKAMFKDFPELFTLTLGKPLEQLIVDKTLVEGVKILFNFRNGIAHARSVVYATYADDLEDDVDYEIGNQYKMVHTYLQKRKLVIRHDDIFRNKISDHFASLVKPYMDAVIPLLPVPQSDNVKSITARAFLENITK